MAVKAKEQVTVSWIIDIASTTKYYLLQSSTATPPSKPTANPPGGNWKTAEPAVLTKPQKKPGTRRRMPRIPQTVRITR